ncbi:hypothetical protein KC19_1G309800 [Ceratodon purpureus]|uniref:Uncharacterized protein n=1 Tax=Ceratodon purpureus TaxID=3225 RepID=A0A8T0JCW5_CERPU|nr:hypothetical protein KC19_1G309800 [Ceratodon purpureus]
MGVVFGDVERCMGVLIGNVGGSCCDRVPVVVGGVFLVHRRAWSSSSVVGKQKMVVLGYHAHCVLR